MQFYNLRNLQLKRIIACIYYEAVVSDRRCRESFLQDMPISVTIIIYLYFKDKKQQLIGTRQFDSMTMEKNQIAYTPTLMQVSWYFTYFY